MNWTPEKLIDAMRRCDDWPIPSNKITAWMPFPKPIKEIKE